MGGRVGELGEPWEKAFELAWQSFQAGSPPVGAVVVGPQGEIVAEGRSRRAEASAPANQLAGSRLAHAEINALAQLALDQRDGYELYVTLEPCLLCWAAACIVGVPKVHFAGADPVWRFVGGLAAAHPRIAERAYESVGPLETPTGAWGTLLPLVERLWREPSGVRVEQFEHTVPALMELGRRLVDDGTAHRFIGLSQEEALGLVWDELLSAWRSDRSRTREHARGPGWTSGARGTS